MNIGILGGGQLGRMLVLSGYSLGLRFRIFDPADDCCAGQVAPHVSGAFDDEEALTRFARGLDLVTFEFENIPAETTSIVSKAVRVIPLPRVLEIAQDRMREKELFASHQIQTAPYERVDSLAQFVKAAERIGFPAVLKTRRMGYDGKGQVTLRSSEDIVDAWKFVGEVACILEGFVRFSRELSLLVVRNAFGEFAFYPWVENNHRQGILRTSKSPMQPRNTMHASDTMNRVEEMLRELQYVGVIAIEFFEVDDVLVANEMAPRVHNTGHWTIEGSVTSQFANHIRAISGFPLGATAAIGHTGMVNIIGTMPSLNNLLSLPRSQVHLYGKEGRVGRKIGHVTVVGESESVRDKMLHRVNSMIGEPD